jgi:hypothetical protein
MSSSSRYSQMKSPDVGSSASGDGIMVLRTTMSVQAGAAPRGNMYGKLKRNFQDSL